MIIHLYCIRMFIYILTMNFIGLIFIMLVKETRKMFQMTVVTKSGSPSPSQSRRKAELRI